jgi:hypothetical protein
MSDRRRPLPLKYRHKLTCIEERSLLMQARIVLKFLIGSMAWRRLAKVLTSSWTLSICDSGQHWEQGLVKRISDSDIFYLFWCRHAMNSEWVAKEWRSALEEKGKEFIDPVPLEAPDVAPLLAELAAKHFYDRLLPFITAAGGGHVY